VNFNEKIQVYISCVPVEIPLFDFVLTGFSPLFSCRDMVLYEQGDYPKFIFLRLFSGRLVSERCISQPLSSFMALEKLSWVTRFCGAHRSPRKDFNLPRVPLQFLRSRIRLCFGESSSGLVPLQ
jgi:hypothetical protein